MLNKIVLLRDYNFVDEIDNPLIESYNVGKKKSEKEENKDKEIVKTTDMILFSKEDTLYDRIVRYLLENDIISIYNEPSKVY
jgi:23S rRNA maturation-related 3'-5' exoribonuclease YhaM